MKKKWMKLGLLTQRSISLLQAFEFSVSNSKVTFFVNLSHFFYPPSHSIIKTP
jgi:hypothetical protein